MSTASGTPAAKKAASRARKNEAAPQPVVVEYDGVTYTIHPDAANDLELLEDLEDENYLRAIRGYLGVDQWGQFKDSHRNASGRVPVEAMEPFLSALLKEMGQGNSSASPIS